MNLSLVHPTEPPGFGGLLPRILVEPPGPVSRRYAGLLSEFESPAISTLANGDLPIFWEAAAGSNVLDADGNVFIDTTSAFGVASVGHRNPRVIAKVQAQSSRLLHGMGDFLPPTARLELAAALRGVLPRGLDRVLFGLSGADAVEIAVKCATVYTGKPGVIAFEGAFHGQSFGTLPLSSREAFSDRFLNQLGRHVRRAPYPDPAGCPKGLSETAYVERCLDAVDWLVLEMSASQHPAACVLVEPCQGREGDIFPPDEFLPKLLALCRAHGVLLVCDEVYTGFGRTGRMWAHGDAVPDLLCAGKALGGGFPISIVAGCSEVMDAWRPTGAEAPHSSTFLGNPLGCAAALAVLEELRDGTLVERCRALGVRLLNSLRESTASNPHVGEVRGRGLMLGIELVRDRASREPCSVLTPLVLDQGLKSGLILLPGGARGNVISLAPPFVITDEQLGYVQANLATCLQVVG